MPDGASSSSENTRWIRINDVFQRAILVHEQQRSGFIAAECCDDPKLRDEVESLVAAHQDTVTGTASRMVPGTQTPYYEITSFLAAGAMGEVYRARDTKLGRNVALRSCRRHS